MGLPLWVTVPTFVCSLLSFLADLASGVSFFLVPPERHFRQALILNLLVADLINSGNNTVSGIVALTRRHEKYRIPMGPGCMANAYIGQFTVQAVDFNILVISLAVLLTVRQARMIQRPPQWKVALVCLIPWIPPMITANIAQALGAWAPTSGNWCWIKKDILLRYSLTHGWRIMIFFVTIGIYTYVYLHLKRAYGQLHVTSYGCSSHTEDDMGSSTVNLRSDVGPPQTVPAESLTPRTSDVKESGHESFELEEQILYNSKSQLSPLPPSVDSQAHRVHAPPVIKHKQTLSPNPNPQGPLAKRNARERKRALQKMLLLNGYPILYIILWIPGIANRLTEIIVGESPLWLTAMQASTQLVGFANAVTYVWNEQMSSRMKERLGLRRPRWPDRGGG